MNNIEGINRYPIIKNETMENIDKSLLSIELKQKMSKWSNLAQNGQIATIDTIDYTKFYKIDKKKLNSANNFSGDLYLIEIDGEYKVISLDGVIYNKEKINIIIPLDDIPEPQYLTVGNNTYKWYGNGDISVIGELNSNSGITNEESEQINGLQEFDLQEISKGTDMAFDKDVQTESKIAKVNGVKKIYFNTGTVYIIDAQNNLWAWGANEYNKLGQGNSYLVTEPIKILDERTEGKTGVKAKNVWAGKTNTFVLDTENRLWACGTNSDGTLGQGNFDIYDNFVQVKIDGLDYSTIKEIDLGVSTQNNSAIITTIDNKIYACGCNVYRNFGTDNNNNYNTFIELTNINETYLDSKKVINSVLCTYVLKSNGELYGIGYNNQGNLGLGYTGGNIDSFTLITNNVKDVISKSNGFIVLKEDGYLYTNDSQGNIIKLEGIQDTNLQFLSRTSIVSNGKYYTIQDNTLIKNYTSYKMDEEILYMGAMNGFISNNKIYLIGFPDVTSPKQKSIYTLKNIFTGAQFAQSGGNVLNIVDNDGNIYEGINNKIKDLDNIKQVVSSGVVNASYAVSENGNLYAKGMAYMWGDEYYKSRYTIVTRNGTEEFNNVDKVFSIKKYYGSIFITKDKQMYWAGGTAYVAIPNLKGDYTGLSGEVTRYPKKVENEIINSIIDNIKDIKFDFINKAGIVGRNALTLTNDGKLYSYSSNMNMTGVGKTTDFTEVKFNGANVEQIETLDGLVLTVLSNGDVYGWGYNTYGILGEGYKTGEVYNIPVKLKLSNVRTMSLGDGFAIFETYAGEVYGIGKNDYGQLGTGNNVGANTFVRCEELEK